MTLPKIGFDFDGVLANTHLIYIDQIKKCSHWKRDDTIWPGMFCHGYNIWVPPETRQWVLDNIINKGLARTMEVSPNWLAIILLNAWSVHTGQAPTVVTSRPLDYSEVTWVWVKKYLPRNTELYFADTTYVESSKLNIIKELNITDFIDDKYSTCSILAQAGLTVWMPMYPWNTNRDTPDGVFAFESFNEVLDYYMSILYTEVIKGEL